MCVYVCVCVCVCILNSYVEREEEKGEKEIAKKRPYEVKEAMAREWLLQAVTLTRFACTFFLPFSLVYRM